MEIAPGTNVRMAKRAVAAILTDEEDEEEEDEEEDEEPGAEADEGEHPVAEEEDRRTRARPLCASSVANLLSAND